MRRPDPAAIARKAAAARRPAEVRSRVGQHGHRFTRELARADDGRVLLGCAVGSELAGCAETIVRPG